MIAKAEFRLKVKGACDSLALDLQNKKEKSHRDQIKQLLNEFSKLAEV